MRIGHVIGKVTLAQQDPAYRGGRFLLVQPFSSAHFQGAPSSPHVASTCVVVYDTLGAALGHVIGFAEGSEAAAPFDQPTPVDAFNAAIVDKFFFHPPTV